MPFFVNVPAVLVLIPVVLIVVFPLPAKVKPKPVPVMPPVKVNVPDVILICDADPKVIAPLQVLLFAKLIKAPPLVMPVPFKFVIAFAIL